MAAAVGPEWLEFDADSPLPMVPTRALAWTVIDHSPLYGAAPKVGEDRPIPGAPGRLFVGRELDEWAFSLRLRITGRYLYDDSAVETTESERRIAAKANLAYWRDNVYLPTGTRDVTFHQEDGDELTGTVVVDGWDFNLVEDSAGDVYVAVLRLLVPASELVAGS